MPKVLISADMEGVSGIVHPVETNPDRYDYERGRVLMTAEVNAVIAGVLDAEQSADVLVADAHGPFRNLLPEDLDQRVRLIRGRHVRWECWVVSATTWKLCSSSATTHGQAPVRLCSPIR